MAVLSNAANYSDHRQSKQSRAGALEAVIERNNTSTSLPVLTIGVPPRVLSSRAYAERVGYPLAGSSPRRGAVPRDWTPLSSLTEGKPST
jgi:hypothetical protein